MKAFKKADAAINKVAKWRTILTGWQVGTRPKGDPECDAIRDHREATIVLRVEVSALLQLLLEKGVFEEDDWYTALEQSASELDKLYEIRFPGARSTDYGMSLSVESAEWMKNWKP